MVAVEFDCELDATVNTFITLAGDFINADLFDNKELALALQAASLMLMRKQSSTGESSGLDLMREREGDLEREYARGERLSTSSTKDIYQKQLDMLAISFAGSCIMTRYGI